VTGSPKGGGAHGATRAPRLWVDMTNSPHVLVLRPIIEEFRRRGWDVDVTARDFAQTLPLLERFGIPHTLIGRHRGRSMLAKAWGLVARSTAMVRFGRSRGFDLALSHASNDLPVAAKLLGVPHVTMFDYEFAKLSHSINVRLSAKSLVPDAIPQSALARYGCTPRKYDAFPGLKEEYYLADFEPDAGVLDELGIDREKVLVILRTPPSMAAYHRMENPLFDDVLSAVGARDDVQAIALVRTPDQRPGIEAAGSGNIIVPDRVVDAQSLVYYADVVVSGGGTLNREAVALGTPAYTVFQGVMGAVDARLMNDGRLTRLERAEDLHLAKKGTSVPRERRDVGSLVDRIASAGRRTSSAEKTR
jgi:predicted glycosyltransferase